jgi:dihydrofolate reductase
MQQSSEQRPIISIIAAMAENRVIGRDGRIPWHLPADLERFRDLTLGHSLVMGRKTYESIGRPLPGRRTIVLSRQPGLAIQGADVAPNLSAALALCAGEAEVFICGGAAVYAEALPIADRIYLTVVHGDTGGDTFFPPIPDTFVETCREPLPGDLPATFIHLRRRD